MKERTPTELMRMYWASCRARGDKPRKVYGLVSMGAPAQQPKGYVIGWGVTLPYVEMLQERHGAGWEIQEFEP